MHSPIIPRDMKTLWPTKPPYQAQTLLNSSTVYYDTRYSKQKDLDDTRIRMLHNIGIDAAEDTTS